MSESIVHQGGCHCGNVRFEFDAPAKSVLSECNCSVCHMSGYLHLFVDKSAFRLVTSEDELSCYEFNTGVAKHYFCRNCGIKSFYIPRSHPHGYSINARCVDSGTYTSESIKGFDGANWEENIHLLRKSRESSQYDDSFSL
jgi:hypothetical protein